MYIKLEGTSRMKGGMRVHIYIRAKRKTYTEHKLGLGQLDGCVPKFVYFTYKRCAF